MTEIELKEKKKKRNALAYEKRKKELKNNRTLNSFIIKPTVVSEPVFPVPVCTVCNTGSPPTPVSTPNRVRTDTSSTVTANPPVLPQAANRISTRVPTRTNSGARHLNKETDFTKKFYSKFSEGSKPNPPIEKERHFIDAQKQFLRRTEDMQLTYCSVCKERWFDTKISNGKCKNCNKFSFANDMDPFPHICPYPFHLPKLTMNEEMLIAKAHVIMAVYRLEKGGSVFIRVTY